MTEPRKGFRFYHRRILDTVKFDGKSPQLCVITRTAQGTVYYRPVYNLGERETLGSPGCFPVEQWSRWCLCAENDPSFGGRLSLDPAA